MLKFLRKIIGEKSPIRFWYYFMKSFVVAVVYAFPGRKLKVIGVTGTDGKTTSVNLITHLLNESGVKTGMISTTTFAIGKEHFINKTKRTSVSPFIMNHLLAKMIQASCEYVVLEVSSHALEQKRFYGVDFDIVALTNITPEHLDYHKNMGEYRRIKALLFKKLGQSKSKKEQPKTMILNHADPVFEQFSKFRADEKYSFGLTEKADFYANEVELKDDKSIFDLNFKNKKWRVFLPLVGEFNIENALLASAVVKSSGLEIEDFVNQFTTFAGVGGRMEKIEAGQDFNVIVDFALTPEALRRLFETAKDFTKGRVIGVLGCTGDRDQTKRKVTGKIAAELLDVFILTDDETYSEDGDEIRKEVKSGISETKKVEGQDWFEVGDRLEAIQFAFKMAKKGDTVLIPGMGVLPDRNMGGKIIQWDEREIVRKELEKIL